jgi:hypothetical protein
MASALRSHSRPARAVRHLTCFIALCRTQSAVADPIPRRPSLGLARAARADPDGAGAPRRR